MSHTEHNLKPDFQLIIKERLSYVLDSEYAGHLLVTFIHSSRQTPAYFADLCGSFLYKKIFNIIPVRNPFGQCSPFLSLFRCCWATTTCFIVHKWSISHVFVLKAIALVVHCISTVTPGSRNTFQKIVVRNVIVLVNKGNVNLPQCLIKHHAMKTCKRVEDTSEVFNLSLLGPSSPLNRADLDAMECVENRTPCHPQCSLSLYWQSYPDCSLFQYSS